MNLSKKQSSQRESKSFMNYLQCKINLQVPIIHYPSLPTIVCWLVSVYICMCVFILKVIDRRSHVNNIFPEVSRMDILK